MELKGGFLIWMVKMKDLFFLSNGHNIALFSTVVFGQEKG